MKMDRKYYLEIAHTHHAVIYALLHEAYSINNQLLKKYGDKILTHHFCIDCRYSYARLRRRC